MTGRDPAVEAARRQLEKQFGYAWTEPGYQSRVRTEAAHEALAPIRELHKPMTVEATSCEEACEVHEDECPTDARVPVCGCCWDLAMDIDPYHGEDGIAAAVQWPCDTAQLIYTEEELTDE